PPMKVLFEGVRDTAVGPAEPGEVCPTVAKGGGVGHAGYAEVTGGDGSQWPPKIIMAGPRATQVDDPLMVNRSPVCPGPAVFRQGRAAPVVPRALLVLPKVGQSLLTDREDGIPVRGAEQTPGEQLTLLEGLQGKGSSARRGPPGMLGIQGTKPAAQ